MKSRASIDWMQLQFLLELSSFNWMSGRHPHLPGISTAPHTTLLQCILNTPQEVPVRNSRATASATLHNSSTNTNTNTKQHDSHVFVQHNIHVTFTVMFNILDGGQKTSLQTLY
jgi:hypothetical protein